MNHPLIQLFVRWAILALGVAIAARIIPGIHYADAGTLFVVAILLSFFNAILRPILLLFTLPFILVTMGFGILVINALLFLFVGKLVQGFEVNGFWSALGGSVIVSLSNLIVSRLLKPSAPSARAAGGPPSPRPPTKKPDDVIDI